MMEKKVHYKMHKVKKNWVAIAVTSLALLVAPKALGLESDVIYADDANQVADVKEQSTVQSKDTEHTTSDKAAEPSQLEAKEQPSSKETYQASAATNPTAKEQTTQQDKEAETTRIDSRQELTQKVSDDSSEKNDSSQEP